MMSPAEQQEFAALKTQVETLLALLAAAGDYAGVDLVSRSEPPQGPVLTLLPGGKAGTRKRVAGHGAGVTPLTALSRRASTPGRAS